MSNDDPVPFEPVPFEPVPFEPQPFEPQPAPPAPPARTRRSRWLVGLGLLVVAALAAGGYALFAGSDSVDGAAGSPRDAAQMLLDAVRANDAGRVRAALCRADQAFGDSMLRHTAPGTVSSYTLGTTTSAKGHTAVHVRVTATDGTTDSTDLPVVKEAGRWKVCPSQLLAQVPSDLPATIPGSATVAATATAVPATQVAPQPPAADLPTVGGAPASSCPSAADAEIPAFIFVGALALEQTQDAQDCVYPGTVDPATTAALSGRAFEKPADDHSDTGAGASFMFTEVGGHGRLRVTTTKEADGRYYVTDVTLR